MATENNPAVKRLEAEKKALLALLQKTRTYVDNAYECAFPDESANEQLIADIDAALAGDILSERPR